MAINQIVVAGPDTMSSDSRLNVGGEARHRVGASMRRPLFSFFRGMVALALLVPVSIIAAGPVAAAPLNAAGACATGTGNVGGQCIVCDVTVVNTITAIGGNATVTVHECLGSAGDPTDGTGPGGHRCTTTVTSFNEPVTAITVCDGSANGGGGKLLCSIKVTNNFVGISPGGLAATVNQCVGSVTTGTVRACNPDPATTSGAAITQCNGTANGGGSSLTCKASGTMASAFLVWINECNGSGGGGGALVVCTASLAGGTSSGTPPPTSALSEGSSPSSTPPIAMLIFALAGLLLATVVVQRRTVRS